VLEYPVKPDSKAMTDKDNLFDENDHMASDSYGLSIMPTTFLYQKQQQGMLSSCGEITTYYEKETGL